MAEACAGLRVVEVTRGMAGALAGMVLADHGAEVIRLEDPAGDPLLTQAGERLWSRGKTRIALDMDDEADRARAQALIREADVLLLGVRPSTAERWGLAPNILERENPALIVATISGFGWTGPRRDEPITENLMHAITGGMMMPGTGGFRDGPIFIAAHATAYGAAMLAVMGTLAALRERDTSGLGQHVDIGLFQAILVWRAFYMWNPEFHQEEFPAFPTSRDHRGIRPLFNLNECADGRWLSMGAWTPALAYKALEVMGLVHLLGEERFAGMPNVIPDDAARSELLEILWARFREEPIQHWLDAMDAQAIPCEPALTIAEFRDVAQLWANDYAVHVDDPVAGAMVQPGVMGELSATPGTIRPAEASARPASETAGIAARWQAEQPVRGEGRVRAGGRGPLAGVRVLDLTVFLSGPMAAHLLCDLGADVVKLEPPEGDDFRVSALGIFRYLHRDKQGVVLDLKTPAGQEGLEHLVRQSDIVMYNYRLGVEERLGLSDERLRALNPEIIVCRITAFGARGERAHRGGYDASISALAGMFTFQAGEGNPPASVGLADISTGIAAATALSMAIRAKETQGVGQHVEVAMIGAMAYVGADSFVSYDGMAPTERLDQGQHGFGPLYRLYETSDGWLMLSAQGATQEAKLRAALGLTGGVALDAAALEPAFAARTTDDLLAVLTGAGVGVAPVEGDGKAYFARTQEFRENQAYIEVPHPHYGRLGQTGPAVRFSRTPVRVERQEPGLGEHNAELLALAAR